MALSNITGSAWPTSGNVTAGNSGFYNVAATAGKLTYKPFGAAGAIDAKPTGCTSASYIEYDTQGVAATAGFYQSDWTDVATAITTGNKTYEQEFFFQIAKTANFVANTTPADATAFYFATVGNVYSGFRIYVQNSAIYGQGMGIRMVVGGSVVGGVETSISPWQGSTVYYPCLKFDTWMVMKIRFKAGLTGYYQIWINGRLISDCSGAYENAGTPLANMQFAFALPAGISTFPSGLVMRFAGPMKASTNITDSTIKTNLMNAVEDCVKDLPIRMQGKDGEARWTRVSGNVTTVAIADYTSSGINPTRYRRSYVGTSGQSEVYETEKLYDPSTTDLYPFNKEGWTSLFIKNFYLPSTSTKALLQLQVYDISNTTAEIDVTINSSGNLVKTGDGTILVSSLSATSSYSLSFHISVSGEVTGTLFKGSNTAHSVGDVVSFKYGTTNIRSKYGIGKLKTTLTVGDGGATACILDGAGLFRILSIPIIDSYIHAPIGTVTPDTPCKNNLGLFRCGEESFSIPGGYSPRMGTRTDLDCSVGPIIARSGQTISTYFTNLRTALEYTRGVKLIMMCGIVNDKSGMTTSNYTTYADYVVTVAANVIKNNNYFWFINAPVPPGSGGVPLTQNFKDAIPLWNNNVITKLRRLGDRVIISDLVSSNPTIVWDAQGIHPDAASCATLWALACTTATPIGASFNLYSSGKVNDIDRRFSF